MNANRNTEGNSRCDIYNVLYTKTQLQSKYSINLDKIDRNKKDSKMSPILIHIYELLGTGNNASIAKNKCNTALNYPDIRINKTNESGLH